MQIERLPGNPILAPTPHVDARVGSNLNGPSLIRVPAWLANPLGRYYLYFAHYVGASIRLAYADQLVPRRSIEPTVYTLCSRLGYRRGICAIRY